MPRTLTALLITCALSATALADPPKPRAFYRLDFTVTDTEGKRVDTHAYSLVLAEHETGEVQAVSNIALGQARLDVGTKLRAQLEVDGDTAVLTTDAEISALAESKDGQVVVNKVEIRGVTALTPGKAAPVGSADAGKERYAVEVTATKVR